jgi:DNA-directed RNA polymerase subunit alpha
MENTIIDKNWKNLIKPNKLNIQSNEDKSRTTVVAEPLEKGFALTIGNSLRRILLSSIQGSAITAI